MGEIYHSWNGTVLTITSDSGTSSADLKGDMGIRGPQGVAGGSTEHLEGLEQRVEDLEAMSGGYVSWATLHEEMESALATYPDFDYIWNNYYTKEETESLIAPQYELIQSFTLTEETKTIELDGFELDKYVLFINSPKSDVEGGCSYRVYKGETQVYNGWVNYIISKADNSTSMLTGKNENGMAFIEAYTSNYSYKSPLVTPGYIEGINPFTKIRLIVNTTSAYSFQVGAKFELWGVRR